MKKQYYIGERINPQLDKSYYIPYGQLTKKEAREKENCAYGFILMKQYNTNEEFEAAKTSLVENGFRVVSR